MQNGTSLGEAGCELHDDPECVSRSDFSSEMFSFPTMSLKSVHAASRFASEMLCFGGMVSSMGTVDEVRLGLGPDWPQ
jgi:hypothetical protein